MPSPIPSITSPNNPHVKRWVSLLEAKGLKRHGQCVVSGKKLVDEILHQHPRECLELICPPNYRHAAYRFPAGLALYRVARGIFDKLDLFGTSSPLLITKIPPLEPANLETPPSGLEILAPTGDPGNLGTLIRSACAFQVEKLTLLREAAHPFHPKTIRASSGSVFKQPLAWGPRLADLDHPHVLPWIVALDLGGDSLFTWQWPKAIRVLIGEEGQGLPAFPFRRRCTIPQRGTVDSLNVTVAASIAMFSYNQQWFSRDTPRGATPRAQRNEAGPQASPHPSL